MQGFVVSISDIAFTHCGAYKLAVYTLHMLLVTSAHVSMYTCSFGVNFILQILYHSEIIMARAQWLQSVHFAIESALDDACVRVRLLQTTYVMYI